MSDVTPIRKTTDRQVRELLLQCAREKPDEVLIVLVRGDCVRTLSTGTFSRMRTIGALEQLKHDILSGD